MVTEMNVALDAYALMRLKEYKIVKEGVQAGFDDSARGEISAGDVFREFSHISELLTLDLVHHLQHLYESALLDPATIVLTLTVYGSDKWDWSFAEAARYRQRHGFTQPDTSWSLIHASRFCGNLLVAYNHTLGGSNED